MTLNYRLLNKIVLKSRISRTFHSLMARSLTASLPILLSPKIEKDILKLSRVVNWREFITEKDITPYRPIRWPSSIMKLLLRSRQHVHFHDFFSTFELLLRIFIIRSSLCYWWSYLWWGNVRPHSLSEVGLINANTTGI